MTTRDPVNRPGFEMQESIGPTRLGVLTNFDWHSDPRRLLFRLARYKFVAKMFSGREHVLELGCGDAFCVPIVLQTVKHLTVSDFDPLFLADARARMREPWMFDTMEHDLLGPEEIHGGPYDGIYALDVLEHIAPADEHQVMWKIRDALTRHGALIIGMPSAESQEYASPPSKAGHVNAKSEDELRSLMDEYFHNVFVFGMNDETLHTGFGPMCHYRLALCVEPR